MSRMGMFFSILIVHSNPGDFLLLDKFTSTGFINKIYNMEASIFFLQNPNNKWAIISLVMDTSATLFVLCC